MESQRITGIIQKLFVKKGYCWILYKPNDGTPVVFYFLHQRNCNGGLRLGAEVSFVPNFGDKGHFATNARIDKTATRVTFKVIEGDMTLSEVVS
jgi:hypothetical protein